jgi:ACS family hexuronate transporter-like MFS transporter
MAFIVIGAIGFLWLIFWFMYYDAPHLQKKMGQAEREYILDADATEVAQQSATSNQKVKWSSLFKYKQTWAFSIGKFLTDGVWWFFLFWLPAYLKDQYGMTGTEIILPLVVLYSLTMVGSIGGGWFPVYYINKGYNAYDGRLKAMFVIALFPLVVLAAQPLGGISFWMPVILIGIGASAHQAWSANIFTTVSDMFPQKAIGSVVGIGGMAGGIGGVIVTKVGGALFDHYKALGHIETGYTIMFTFCATAYLVAWVIMKSLVPKFKLITDL